MQHVLYQSLWYTVLAGVFPGAGGCGISLVFGDLHFGIYPGGISDAAGGCGCQGDEENYGKSIRKAGAAIAPAFRG